MTRRFFQAWLALGFAALLTGCAASGWERPQPRSVAVQPRAARIAPKVPPLHETAPAPAPAPARAPMSPAMRRLWQRLIGR